MLHRAPKLGLPDVLGSWLLPTSAYRVLSLLAFPSVVPPLSRSRAKLWQPGSVAVGLDGAAEFSAVHWQSCWSGLYPPPLTARATPVPATLRTAAAPAASAAFLHLRLICSPSCSAATQERRKLFNTDDTPSPPQFATQSGIPAGK